MNALIKAAFITLIPLSASAKEGFAPKVLEKFITDHTEAKRFKVKSVDFTKGGVDLRLTAFTPVADGLICSGVHFTAELPQDETAQDLRLTFVVASAAIRADEEDIAEGLGAPLLATGIYDPQTRDAFETQNSRYWTDTSVVDAVTKQPRDGYINVTMAVPGRQLKDGEIYTLYFCYRKGRENEAEGPRFLDVRVSYGKYFRNGRFDVDAVREAVKKY